MNKKVFKTMLVLVIAFLASCYVIKIFFPEQFVMSVENEALVSAGAFVDSHRWLYFIISILFGVLFDYLYFGAVCRKTKFHWTLWVVIGLYNVGLGAVLAFVDKAVLAQYSGVIAMFSSIYMIFLPAFYTNELMPLAVTYTTNFIAQTLSLNIRNISVLMTNTNSLTTALMSIECYFWMLLLFIIFNYTKNKGDAKMGWCKPLYNKGKGYYERKLAKLNAKIGKLTEEKIAVEAILKQIDADKEQASAEQNKA